MHFEHLESGACWRSSYFQVVDMAALIGFHRIFYQYVWRFAWVERDHRGPDAPLLANRYQTPLDPTELEPPKLMTNPVLLVSLSSQDEDDCLFFPPEGRRVGEAMDWLDRYAPNRAQLLRVDFDAQDAEGREFFFHDLQEPDALFASLLLPALMAEGEKVLITQVSYQHVRHVNARFWVISRDHWAVRNTSDLIDHAADHFDATRAETSSLRSRWGHDGIHFDS